MPLPAFLGPFVDLSASPAAAAPAGPPADGVILPFTMQVQQQTEWCWAATAASVSAFYNVAPVLSQCQIASECLGGMECCITPLPPPPPPYWEGNCSYALDAALNVVKHLAAGPTGDILPFASIMNEINGRRPICCHISTGHFNAIVGYHNDSNQDLVVRDPLYGEHIVPYRVFVSGNNGSVWDDTYLTK